jgi:hypothetical protein
MGPHVSERTLDDGFEDHQCSLSNFFFVTLSFAAFQLHRLFLDRVSQKQARDAARCIPEKYTNLSFNTFADGRNS